RGALNVFRVNIADERGDVDLARAGIHAQGVVAIQAARRFEVRLAVVERRREVGEVAGEGGRIFIGMREMVEGLDHGFCLTVIEVLPLMGSVWITCISNVGAGLPAMAEGLEFSV